MTDKCLSSLCKLAKLNKLKRKNGIVYSDLNREYHSRFHYSYGRRCYGWGMEEPPTRGISTYRLHAVSRIRLANSPCVSGASHYLVISILFVIVAVVVVLEIIRRKLQMALWCSR